MPVADPQRTRLAQMLRGIALMVEANVDAKQLVEEIQGAQDAAAELEYAEKPPIINGWSVDSGQDD